MNQISTRITDTPYDMSQQQVAEKLFLRQQSIGKIEKRAIEKFVKILNEKGYKIEDLLNL